MFLSKIFNFYLKHFSLKSLLTEYAICYCSTLYFPVKHKTFHSIVTAIFSVSTRHPERLSQRLYSFKLSDSNDFRNKVVSFIHLTRCSLSMRDAALSAAQVPSEEIEENEKEMKKRDEREQEREREGAVIRKSKLRLSRMLR